MVWMQDNAPVNQTADVQHFFDSNNTQKICCLARSADLNPVENVWGIITQKIDKMID